MLPRRRLRGRGKQEPGSHQRGAPRMRGAVFVVPGARTTALMGAFVNHQYGTMYAGGQRACPRRPRPAGNRVARRGAGRSGESSAQRG